MFCDAYVMPSTRINDIPSTLEIEREEKLIRKYWAKDKSHSGNGAPRGAFAFTLTKSSKDESLTVGDMIGAVKKIMNQRSCPVKRYAWYLEYKGIDEHGLPIHPHVHGMYETHTGGRIEAKHFKRAWKVWKEEKSLGAGHVGGYHRPVRSEERYEAYIKKDGGLSESYNIIPPDQ